MAGIFISYRRQDSSSTSGRIYDRLIDAFGDVVFKDVYDIPAGQNFPTFIRSEMAKSDVALIIIGPQWLSIADASGRPRLKDSQDFVRQEVEIALKQPDTLVIPVLVQGALMPSAEQLPPTIKPLAYRNALVIREDPDFPTDMQRLIEQIVEQRPHYISEAASDKRAASWRNRRKSEASRISSVFLMSMVMVGILGVAAFIYSRNQQPSSLGEEDLTLTATQPALSVPTPILSPTPVQSAAKTPQTARGGEIIYGAYVPEGDEIYSIEAIDGQDCVKTAFADDTLRIRLTETNGSDLASLPFYSPDGSKIAYLVGTADFKQLYVMNAAADPRDQEDYQAERINVRAEGTDSFLSVENYSWSPDGNKFVVEAGGSEPNALYIVDLKSGNSSPLVHRLTDKNVYTGYPSWSPNGLMIAYVQCEMSTDSNGEQARNNETCHIYTAPLANGGTRLDTPLKLTSNPDGNNFKPSWSPDSTRLVFSSYREDGTGSVDSDIYMMDADGKSLATQLTTHAGRDWQPAWSPDGTRIVFGSDRARSRSNDFDIYVMDATADGESEAERLTCSYAFDGFPAWRP